MVDFGSSIEGFIKEEDVEDKALRIAVERHRNEHKGEEHHVEIREKSRQLSEAEESIIEEMSQKSLESEAYKRATSEQANAHYGRISSDERDYQHSHGSRQAECTCGWRATPEHAINEFMPKEDDKSRIGAAYSGTAGPSYNNRDSLEGMAHSYSFSNSGYN